MEAVISFESQNACLPATSHHIGADHNVMAIIHCEKQPTESDNNHSEAGEGYLLHLWALSTECACKAHPKTSSASISSDVYQELNIAQNALNEICKGVGLGEEFETRVGATLADARALLAKIEAIQRT
jgi:hypothetical protein